MESSSSQAVPVPAFRAPRRPFLVALALAGLMGGVELTPALPMAEPPRLKPVPVAPAAWEAPVEEAPVDSAELERRVVARFEHRPLARFLGGHTRQSGMAERIARAIVKEAKQLRVEPSLLTGVLLTENARLEPEVVSSQGAIGLMQVMRFHAGEYDCASDNLREVESNICHGARVFGYYLKRTGDVRRALRRYNGCVRGTNTPNCGRYPSKVLRTAGRVRYELLTYGDGQGTAGQGDRGA
ncbi:MAG: transglycosylase SLT domain-containing protein, partial [Gemmatimonadales bacterium]|nr:transglycosylase SLT domain-containing protein [Gemmatimonadales bacterium]MBA3556208.1 transglycosylase SLT domain-containing protein [Gemmatimonadales bacterium]